jgi:hypothetical protein
MNWFDRIFNANPFGLLDDLLSRPRRKREAAAAQRSLEATVSFLGPKFNLRIPAPGYAPGNGTLYSPLTGCVTIPHDAPADDYGEEVGHYLHHQANHALWDLISKDDAFFDGFTTLEGAKRYLALRNWQECLGRYAGMAYSRHTGVPPPTGAEYAKLFREDLQMIEENQRAIHWKRRKKFMDGVRWDKLHHIPGYRAADALAEQDPFGNRLEELARLNAMEAIEYAASLPGWQEEWAALEERYRQELPRLCKEYGRD